MTQLQIVFLFIVIIAIACLCASTYYPFALISGKQNYQGGSIFEQILHGGFQTVAGPDFQGGEY